MKNKRLSLGTCITKAHKIETITIEALKKVKVGSRIVYTPNHGVINQHSSSSTNQGDSVRHMYVSD